MWRWLALGLLVAALASCASTPPGWVSRPPSDDAFLFAVGSAGPNSSGNPLRSREIAFARALDYLGKSIRVRVTTGTTLIDTERWTQFTSESIQFSDEDLQGVEIVETWTGKQHDGQPHLTYVLVRMPRDLAFSIGQRQR